MSVHPTGTEMTTISYEDGEFVVTGRGGYDGYVRRTFSQVEDAMDYAATLWGLDSGIFDFNKSIVGFPKKRLIRRYIKKAFGG